jgi:hypothetical protein
VEVRPAEVRLAEVRVDEVRHEEVRSDEGRTAEVRPEEVHPVEVRLTQIGLAEVRLVQIRLAQIRLAEVRPPEFRLGEVRSAEVRPVEIRLAEVRLKQVRLAEIERCLRVLLPPLIPDFDSLFKHREMFGIRRGASKWVGFATANDTLAPNSAAIYEMWRRRSGVLLLLLRVHPARRDLLETSFLRNDLANSDQPYVIH